MSETHTRKPRRIRHSLNGKAFLITLILTMGIGLAVLVAGAFMYLVSISHEYYISTWNQANSEAAVLEQTEYRKVCDKVIGMYDSIPDEEKGDGEAEGYKANYASFVDDDYRDIQAAMQGLKSRNGPMNAFIVALDGEKDRMIYLVDSDPDEKTTCWPGTWDTYPHHEIDALINGAEPSKLSTRQGINDRIQAAFTNHEEYGPRVTAAATLYTTDRYAVVVCVDEKLSPIAANAKIFLYEFIILLLVVTLFASFIGMRLMRHAMVRPINKMAKAATLYGSDKNKDTGIKYFDNLNIRTGDEIEQLAYALRDMETDVEEYMNDLTRVTAEKEHINTELSLAARIQHSMLTAEFPPFPDRTEFDIYASMEPAREIGGDFYDMIMVDDDHLLVEIADVSGKGIPAALFMMSSKILLADGARDKISPASILEHVNDAVCANNPEEMFITVWLGILEISTGKLTTASAGHEYPILVHADGTAEFVRDKHGFVMGGMEGMEYTDTVIQMEKGDRIFVYTDGVTEAMSTEEELFGTQRIIDAIRAGDKDASPKEILHTVRTAIAEFTVDAEMFDDLTMLCLEYLGK